MKSSGLRKTKTKILFNLVIISLLFFPFSNIRSETLEDLNRIINEKKSTIDNLNKQQLIYQNKIKQKQQEGVTLNNEISILNTKIASRTIGIETTNLQIENLELEIRATNMELEKKQNELNFSKENIKESLRQLYKEEDNNNSLKALLLNQNLSDFFDEISKLKSIQSSLQEKVEKIKNLQNWLTQKNDSLTKSKQDLEGLKTQLSTEQEKLKDEQGAKFIFLSRAENDEKKFNKLLAELRKEQNDANNLIASYEQKARELLAKKNAGKTQTSEALSWPVPSRTVTTYFHDPDYPFRSIFEHPAIDIRAAQGTAVRAAASGYVAIAKDNGYGYNYIMIVHNNGLSTVYGHISKISARTGDFVVQGDIIGLSGGMPGTLGAGRLTTGPHLHFEVRMNGTPVNPLNYL